MIITNQDEGTVTDGQRIKFQICNTVLQLAYGAYLFTCWCSFLNVLLKYTLHTYLQTLGLNSKDEHIPEKNIKNIKKSNYRNTKI